MHRTVESVVLAMYRFLRDANREELLRSIRAITPASVSHFVRRLVFPREMRAAGEIYGFLNDLSIDKSESSAQRIEQYKSERIVDFLRHAYANTEYYRDLFDSYQLDPNEPNVINAIPPIDKSTVRANASRLLPRNLSDIKHFRLSTGGSTGEPLNLVLTRLNGFVDAVHQKFCFERMGYVPGDRVVAFDGVNVPACLRRRGIYWAKITNEDVPYGSVHFSSHYLGDDTVAQYIRQLRKLRPSIVRGYPSAINSVAERLIKDREEIGHIVKGVQLTAEQVFDWQIENISRGFGADVYLQYGHSEMCVFGFTQDESFNYYCSPFYGHVEVLNEMGQHVREGEAGEVVATGFHNRAMPLIRYRTGDIAVYGGQESGFVMLSTIEGREQDYVYSRDGRPISITGIVFGQHYKAFKNIKKWQIEQNAPGEVMIKIVAESAFSEADSTEITGTFGAQAGVAARVVLVDQIPLTRRGKFRFVTGRMSEGCALQ